MNEDDRRWWSREKQSVSRYVLKMKLEYPDSFEGEIECISKGGVCMCV